MRTKKSIARRFAGRLRRSVLGPAELLLEARRAALDPGLKVAVVADTFTTSCLRPEVNLLELHATTWKLQCDAFRPDLVFVESAWRGRGDSWRGLVAAYDRPRKGEPLSDLVSYCRRRGIATAFWNKEDPVHYERFVEATRGFDLILTTDANCVSRYRRAGRANAMPWLFAAQPEIHHPGFQPPTASVCFAGSYGDPEFSSRHREVEFLLDGATDFPLVIYDRRYHERGTGRPEFPSRFEPLLRPGIPYEDLCREYRRHAIFLNANTVSDSPTMFARRVFELLASGATVVGAPHPGIDTLFRDVVHQCEDAAQTRAVIGESLRDEPARRERAARGVDSVLMDHTYAHRVQELCAALGLSPRPDLPAMGIAFAGSVADLDRIARVREAQQTSLDEIHVGWTADSPLPPDHATRGSLSIHDLRSMRSEDAAARLLGGIAPGRTVVTLCPRRAEHPSYARRLIAGSTIAAGRVVGFASAAGSGWYQEDAILDPSALCAPAHILSDLGWAPGEPGSLPVRGMAVPDLAERSYGSR